MMTMEEIRESKWPKLYLEQAKTIANWSKDPSTKVGCVIVDQHWRPVSQGFNGFPAKCDESFMTYERPMKYHLILHAEQNALAHAHCDLMNHIAITTHAPCETCLKLMAAHGIKVIMYGDVGPIQARGTKEQKEAIALLVGATGMAVENAITGQTYLEELDVYPDPPGRAAEKFFSTNQFQIAGIEILQHFKITPGWGKLSQDERAIVDMYATSGELSKLEIWFSDKGNAKFAQRTREAKERVKRSYRGTVIGV